MKTIHLKKYQIFGRKRTDLGNEKEYKSRENSFYCSYDMNFGVSVITQIKFSK